MNEVTMDLDRYDDMCDYIHCLDNEVKELRKYKAAVDKLYAQCVVKHINDTFPQYSALSLDELAKAIGKDIEKDIEHIRIKEGKVVENGGE